MYVKASQAHPVFCSIHKALEFNCYHLPTRNFFSYSCCCPNFKFLCSIIFSHCITYNETLSTKTLSMNITKDVLLRHSQEELAEFILALVDKSSDAGKHLKVILAKSDPDPTRSISIIKKDIASLKKSKKFVSYNRSFDVSTQIERVQAQIMGDVLPKSPNEAVKLLRTLVDISNHTMERVDDSGGSVWCAFSGACEDLAKAYEQATYPLNDVVNFVYNCLMNDGYGIYDKIIPYYKNALGDSGLQALREKFKNSGVSGHKVSTVREALQSIADVCNDVNAYIEACSFCQERPAPHEHINIAERFIKHGRGREAIPWLDSADVPEWKAEEKRKLKRKALEQSRNVAQVELEE